MFCLEEQIDLHPILGAQFKVKMMPFGENG